MKNKLVVLAVAVGLLVAAGPMLAHHSMANFDRENPVTLQGTVTKFVFSNPHAQLYFEVKDENGNVEQWAAGLGSPRRMFRDGWNLVTLKPGEPITVTCAPDKEGSKRCVVRRPAFPQVGPNGKVLGEGGTE